MSKVSVVVIAKNAEKTIARCIESLLRQSYPCEIIVVDGHSTDATREIVKHYPVKLIEAPPRDTYGVSRNVGVKNASGDFILFQDSDDFVEPTWCESLVRHFKNDPRVGIVIVKRSSPAIYRPNDWFTNLYRKRKSDSTKNLPPHVVREASWHEVNTKGSAFLKKAILEAGGFDEDMFFGTEDKELAYRIFKKGYKIIYEPNVTVYCKPLSGVLEYLKDKFSRAGMGHGHVRRKHGVYRPPLSEAGALALILLGIALWNWNIILALFSFLLSLIALRDLIKEVLNLKVESKEVIFVPPYFLIRFLGYALEFIGFTITYIIPAKRLRQIKERLYK